MADRSDQSGRNAAGEGTSNASSADGAKSDKTAVKRSRRTPAKAATGETSPAKTAAERTARRKTATKAKPKVDLKADETRTPARPARKAKAPATKPATKPEAPKSAAPANEDKPTPVTSDAEARAKGLVLGASAPTAQKLAENIERIESLTRRLLAALSERKTPSPRVEVPGPELALTASSAWMKLLAEQPARVIEQQVNYWGQTLKNYTEAQLALAKGGAAEPDDGPTDKRFRNPLWQTHPFFKLIKRQYLTNAEALKRAASDLELPDDVARRRLDWLTNQIIDMMAPTNFLATNPDALERAIETEGESLVKGLENLVRDVEMHGGEMIVSLADRDAFTVGENIGTAEGRVVHRTPLFELIQYAPTTDQVHELPLIIFPPWINKFYIMDLKPENSLIRWTVAQGHTLFVVSWKNPDESYADTGLEDYMTAYLEAMDKVRELTGQPRLNAVGYCIAGTTLSLVLALLKKRGDDRVNSATFFTTLTDFSDQGEFVNFLQDDFIEGIAEEVERHGLLRAPLMSRTMSFLRPNDLVWGPAIRSYMLGESPPAFDLLFWNGDSTNLPGKMAVQYLRGLCQRNLFATEGFEIMGEKLHISDVTLPICSVACEADHIAPWRNCWKGVSLMGSKDRTFLLSESGHVAGIVNPPTRKKYGHYVGGRDFDHGCDAWRESATYKDYSWWPSWGEWLAERAGGMVPARAPIEGLEPAPGSYVHERAM